MRGIIFSHRAVVWCHSGCNSGQYSQNIVKQKGGSVYLARPMARLTRKVDREDGRAFGPSQINAMGSSIPKTAMFGKTRKIFADPKRWLWGMGNDG